MRVREAYQYCADYLSDASDGKADRVIRRIVNAALSELSASHPWTRYQAAAQIPLDVGVNGAAVSIAQDDDVLTFGATSQVRQKWLAEKWGLTITGDTSLRFALGSIDSTLEARLKPGQRWLQAAAVAATHVWTRHVYPLPDGCKAVREILLSTSRVGMIDVAPTVLDALLWETPTQTGQPINFTVRERQIEVWPPLGPTTTREALLVAYERQPAVLTDQSDEDAALDWDERWDDLFQSALDVTIASKHAAQTTVNLGAVAQRYRDRLQRAKGEDGQRTPPAVMFGLRELPELASVEALRFRRFPQGPDA